MQAFRNAGAMRFVQGRRLFAMVSGHSRPAPGPDLPQIPSMDPFGRPQPHPSVMETIEHMRNLTAEEKLKFGFIFSEILGLPNPPEPAKVTTGGFVVKLVKVHPGNNWTVLREVAWVKSLDSIPVVKHLSELGLGPSVHVVQNVPSVIKEGVSEEEANQIIAKIQAAGGVAVMEPMKTLE